MANIFNNILSLQIFALLFLMIQSKLLNIQFSLLYFLLSGNGEFRSVDAREVSAEYYFKNKLSFLVQIHDHLEYH